MFRLILIFSIFVPCFSFAQAPRQHHVPEKDVQGFVDALSPRGSRIGYLVSSARRVVTADFLDRVGEKLYGDEMNVSFVDLSKAQSETEIWRYLGAPPGIVASNQSTDLERILEDKKEHGALIVFMGVNDAKVLGLLRDRLYPKLLAGKYVRDSNQFDLSKFTFVIMVEKDFVVGYANGVNTSFTDLKGIASLYRTDATRQLTFASVDIQKLKSFIWCQKDLGEP